jgi:hypothetical protein
MHVGNFDYAVTLLTRKFNRDVAVIAVGQAMMTGIAVLKDTEIVFDKDNLSFGIEWGNGEDGVQPALANESRIRA